MELNKLSLIQSLAFHKDWTGRTAQKLGWVTVILHRIWIVNANFNQRQSLIAGNLRTEKFWNSMRRHVPADAHLLHSLLPFFFLLLSTPLFFSNLQPHFRTSTLPLAGSSGRLRPPFIPLLSISSVSQVHCLPQPMNYLVYCKIPFYLLTISFFRFVPNLINESISLWMNE